MNRLPHHDDVNDNDAFPASCRDEDAMQQCQSDDQTPEQLEFDFRQDPSKE